MRKESLIIAVLFLSAVASQAQKPFRVERTKSDLFPEWVEFAESDAPVFRSNQVWLIDPQGRSSISSTLRPITKEKDQIGFEHHRMQQMYNNIPVEHAVYIAHVKNGKLLSQNGKWVKDFPSGLTSKPALTEAAALIIATQYVGAKSYKWEDPAEEAFIKTEQNDPRATFKPKGELVYYSGQEELDGPSLKLAYKFDVYAADPVGRKIIYVDAIQGGILGYNDLIHEADAIGTAVTAYSGSKTITTDKVSATSYRLREAGRGNGIQTYNLQKKTTYSLAVDFTDADNSWNNVNTNKDQYATDAHWGAEQTYDFFKNNFNRNSIDGNGFALKSYVHYSNNYFNAFWDGSRMTYGDGSSTNGFKPLTAIDVCAHEITHGLTSKTSNLNYSGESGAMNEGFSDIFGTAIEKFARPTQSDWLIGGDFYTIRNMSNPNQYSDPDTYKGSYWYTGTGDNGGVHTNSGVLNFWFYLLTGGGSGTNDKGFAYSVTGLGITKAQAIAYRTLTYYLVSTSNYAAARTASIKAARDLYGATADSVQVKNAWNAVGVGGGTAPALLTRNSSTAALEGITSSANVFPNPFGNRIQVSITDENGGSRLMELVDVKGSTVLRRSIIINKGNNVVDLETSAVKPGIYFVNINNKRIGSVVKQ
jgi:Zn-dependent metalloprotease